MMTRRIVLTWLDDRPDAPFPPISQALRDPNGLLAAGGDLCPERLLRAYRQGIFPWYSEGEPILWWCPGPRAVFRTDGVHLSGKFRRQLRRSDWVVRADTAFEAVIDACALMPRPGQDGTWITRAIREAYASLHRLGHAHSIEVYDAGGALVGGLYGLAIGRMFFGESMVSLRSGGSKVALAALARRLHGWNYPWIDCQVENPHLMRLGADRVPLADFLAALPALTEVEDRPGSWTEAFGSLPASALADGIDG